ncbi:MAG: hypothetical protein AAF387_20925 [Pseudomonadota bacterium]
MCHQTGSLIARDLEAAGIPTLIYGSARDIMLAARPPRAVFTDYPLGHSVGRPFDKANQRAIVRDGLNALQTIDAPETIIDLPYEWTLDPKWKTAENNDMSDTRSPRGDEPVYQIESDRIAAEGH